jgi:hypothetical protein
MGENDDKMLTINNLENGKSGLSYADYRGSTTPGLKVFVDNNSGKIFKVNKGETIDCKANNYYYERYTGDFGQVYFTDKIDSLLNCNGKVEEAVEDTSKVVYRVERKNKPMGERLKTGVTGMGEKIKGFSLFGNKSAATGGRRSRKSKKQSRSRKQSKSRKTRR